MSNKSVFSDAQRLRSAMMVFELSLAIAQDAVGYEIPVFDKAPWPGVAKQVRQKQASVARYTERLSALMACLFPQAFLLALRKDVNFLFRGRLAPFENERRSFSPITLFEKSVKCNDSSDSVYAVMAALRFVRCGIPERSFAESFDAPRFLSMMSPDADKAPSSVFVSSSELTAFIDACLLSDGARRAYKERFKETENSQPYRKPLARLVLSGYPKRLLTALEHAYSEADAHRRKALINSEYYLFMLFLSLLARIKEQQLVYFVSRVNEVCYDAEK